MYKYSFNGKEKDDEVKGGGNQQDYGFRVYDPRLGKFLSVDPLYKDYPWNSTYAFAENDVIRSTDLDGAEKNIQIQYQATKSSVPIFKTIPWNKNHPGQENGPRGSGTLVLKKIGNLPFSYKYFPSLRDFIDVLLFKKLDDKTASKNAQATHSGKGTGSNADAKPEEKIYDPHSGGTNPNFAPDGGKVALDDSKTKPIVMPDEERKSADGSKMNVYNDGKGSPAVGVGINPDGDTMDVYKYIEGGAGEHNRPENKDKPGSEYKENLRRIPDLKKNNPK